MDYPYLSFHVHQILSALRDVSNHLPYLPDQHREVVTEALNQLGNDFAELVTNYDAHSGTETLADEYTASDKTVDMAPFIRSDTIDFFDNYVALNQDGQFTYGNPIAFSIFGIRDRDLSGENIWEVFPELVESPLYTTFQDAVKSRMPKSVEMQGQVNRWLAINIHPTGRGVIIYWLDITARKEIERSLRDAEERLRVAFETAPINVFTLDKELRYVWIGPRSDGSFHEPVLGKRDDETLPAQDAAILMEAEQYVIDTGNGLRKEVRFTKDGRSLIYNMALEPLFDPLNQVIGITIAVMDVTELRQLEADRLAYAAQVELQHRLIEHSEQERVELSRILHDGPIQNIAGLGFSLQLIKEMLKKGGGNINDPLHQMGDDIKNVMDELRAICSDLRPAALTHFGLHPVIEQHVEEFQKKHPETKISLEWDNDQTSIPDPISLALYRIYQNAMSNITRHAHASQVWVRVKLDQQQVHMEIQDNGQGFSNPVDWNEYASRGHFGVVGMKERAEAVGGTLKLHSQTGEGTLVQVTVPVQQ